MLNLIPRAFGYYIPYRTINRKENKPNKPIFQKSKIRIKIKSVSKNEKTDK